ncbi:hypothetical protein ANO11243_027960 [Dothideomycetidae sp. 11243]|nr:hypothetical protein ANO11243_027960 [fungal sp. No.11243]
MSTIALGEYLWRRILEVGIESVMGLPGDFNLQLLDHIYNVEGLRWIGTANELNAAYAVDGYARIKNVPGCIVTTHGVGELSALNAIAGSLTEQVKVIHIVGQTTRPMQKNRMMIHHSIGSDPDHQIFNSASKRFRVAEAELWDIHNACEEIDRVIRECFIKSGPVYIFLPLDLVDEMVPADRLKTPIDVSMPKTEQTKATMASAAKEIASAIAQSKNPAIFVDCLLMRHNAVNEARKLFELLGFPIYQSCIGMGIVDPKSKQLIGIYNGKISSPGVCEAFDSSDLLLVFGRLPADTNSGGFTQNMPVGKTIEFKPTEVDFRGMKSFEGLYYQDFIPYLTEHLSSAQLPKVTIPTMPKYTISNPGDKEITTAWFWPRFTEFLQEGDSLVADTGTSLFGLQDCDFPSHTTYNSQTYYGSIGYATPAAMGAELARQELTKSKHPSAKKAQTVPKRTLLITGDGSIQLTVAEIGTMYHYGACPILVVINNNGYTVERCIHGAKQKYNDIVPYDWSRALEFFGMPAETAKNSFVRCSTREEVEAMLKMEQFRNPKNVMIVEVMMDPFDAPWKMLNQIGQRGEATLQEMRDGGFTLRHAVLEK